MINNYISSPFPAGSNSQADEGLSHQAGEALVQKWAQESNVDLGSALEIGHQK